MMSSFLSQFKPELKQEMNIKNKKILCIVEGKEELKYIYNLFKLNGAKEQCDELSKNKIKVSWGRDIIVVNKCNFKGGGCYKDIPVPVPAQESLEFEKDNLWLYDSIIVMFDGDKDNNNKVNNYFLKKQESLGNLILLVSQPCFESTLIDYCLCEKCRTDVNSMKNGKYPCDKYKNNFSSLNCFKGIGHLIANLDKYPSPDNEILVRINDNIKTYMKEVA